MPQINFDRFPAIRYLRRTVTFKLLDIMLGFLARALAAGAVVVPAAALALL